MVLFNNSAPVALLIAARAAGKTVVLRVDGLYFDSLSPQFLRNTPRFGRFWLQLLSRLNPNKMLINHAANLINENWKVFLRMLFAHHIIYQSNYSKSVYQKYFPKKTSTVIVNGSKLTAQPADPTPKEQKDTGHIRLVTIFDEWRPSKRMVDLINFVRWAHESQGENIELTLLGYTGQFGAHAPPDMARTVETSTCFKTLPRFSDFSGAVRDSLLQSDLYVTFSYRDACPNVVVEAMAHGLPVVGLRSGGIPDIVGDAGILIASNDPGDFFGPSRFESDFPKIDFDEALAAIKTVKSNISEYRAKVRRRFEDDLSIEVVARRYMAAMSRAL